MWGLRSIRTVRSKNLQNKKERRCSSSKKGECVLHSFCCSPLLFFEYLCLTICFSWISSRTNVLLRRMANFKGLYLVGYYTSNAIKTNMDASQEYDRLRKDSPFVPDLGLPCKSTDLSITWLDIRSLRKHAIDFFGDVHFHTDILTFAYRNISCRVKIFLTYS